MEFQAKQAAEVKVATPKDQLDSTDLPYRAKTWLRDHPEYLSNPRKNAKIQDLHYVVIDEGHEPYSQGYFESMETHLGMRQKEQIVNEDNDDDDPPQRTRPAMVSAPVSREAPSNGSGDRPGRITLTVAQKEAAKIAGISEKEYAEQVIKLKEHKLNGNYGGAP